MNPEIFANLRSALATLYTDEASIQRVIADAGLTPARLKLNATLIDLWHSVLTEADKLEQMEMLLVVAEQDYGSNQQLRLACAAWREARAQGSRLRAAIDVPVPEQKHRHEPPVMAAAKEQGDAPDVLHLPRINHDDAIALFQQLLAPGATQRVMRLLGDGKMGKSWLLREIFPKLIEQQAARRALIELRSQAQNPVDLLLVACSQLARTRFPAFDQAYETWLARPKIQVTDLRALFSRISVNSHQGEQEMERIVPHLTRKFVDDLHQLDDRPAVLLFDAVDTAIDSVQNWLMETLLVQLHALSHVRVVVAGRQLPDALGSYALACCSYELRPVYEDAAYIRYCRDLKANLPEEHIPTLARAFNYSPGRFAEAIQTQFMPGGLGNA